jgi:hypothetical protein
MEEEYHRRLAALGIDNTSSLRQSYSNASYVGFSSVTTTSSFSNFKGGKPFQEIEKCDCSTYMCSCGLSIPECVEQDHKEVCMNPTTGHLPCPVGCGHQSLTRGEMTNHLKHCYKYEYVCKCKTDLYHEYTYCNIQVPIEQQGSHWEESHRRDPDLGDFLPPTLKCPNCDEVMQREEFGNHLMRCKCYRVKCHWCNQEMLRQEIDYHGDYLILYKATECVASPTAQHQSSNKSRYGLKVILGA